jgi:hypothetical protein
MRTRLTRRASFLLAILLAAIGSAYSQQSAGQSDALEKDRQKAVSYTFVSPNTRENLTLAEALRLLNSAEELRLLKDIRRLSLCLKLKPVVMKTIGSWTDGAEHSTMFRVYTDTPTVRYTDARLGKVERQKSVLYFRQDASGTGRMYVLYVWRGQRSLAAISRTLDKSGIEFRTLAPRPRRLTIIYVVDLRNELHKQIVSASRRLRARLVLIKGTGDFIGDSTDRDKAQQVFAQEIKRYENENPVIARTCSQ